MKEKIHQAHKKFCAVYGVKALKKIICQYWFAKFRDGDFSLKEEQHWFYEIVDLQIQAIIDDHHRGPRECTEARCITYIHIKSLEEFGNIER